MSDDEKDQAIEALTAERDAVRAEAEQLRAFGVTATEKIEQLGRIAAEEQAKLAAAGEEVERLRRDLGARLELVAKAEDAKHAAEERATAAEAKAGRYAQRIVTLEAQLADAAEWRERTTEAIRTNGEDVVQLVAGLRARIKELEAGT